MRKRITMAVAAALLTVSMTVTAFAAGSNSGSNAASNAAANTSKPASSQPSYTTPTGQPITAELVTQLAAVTENGGSVAPVSPAVLAAVSTYLKAVSPNAAVVAAFTDNSPAGETTINCGAIYAGTDYSVVIHFADGRVVILKPKKVVKGKLIYDKPAGAIASITVAANATAPR